MIDLNYCQRFANMARSRFFPGCLLITCMVMLLLICLDDPMAAMGYDLLLGIVIFQPL